MNVKTMTGEKNHQNKNIIDISGYESSGPNAEKT